MIIGYKCFNNDFTNNYGKKFEVGKKYTSVGKIKYGTSGNGFHMCKDIENTFRYFDALNNDVKVCIVLGSGNIINYKDEYNEYYDMYCVENIEILKLLTREEIINIGLNLDIYGAKRFVSEFRLTKEEIEKFLEKYKKYPQVMLAIEYYQNNNKDIYNLEYEKKKRLIPSTKKHKK